MTSLQLKLIHIAKRQLALDEPRYRLLLRNVADAGSAKDLTLDTFEDVMAVMEDMGFRTFGKPSDYFRAKVSARGVTCGDRMAWKIRQRCQQTRYPIEGMCLRMSLGRADRPEKLNPLEAFNLIEALRDIIKREGGEPDDGSLFDSSPALSLPKQTKEPALAVSDTDGMPTDDVPF